MVIVHDDVLSPEDLADYLKRLEFARFGDTMNQGIKYSDVTQDLSGDKIYQFIENETLFGPPQNVINFLRAYKHKPDHVPSMWIHSDRAFADYIGIFFVKSSRYPQDDGFALWKNKDLDAKAAFSQREHEYADTQTLDPEKWELWQRVEYKQNRLVICPASYFHSCMTYGHKGTNLSDCRIVHVLFFNQEKK